MKKNKKEKIEFYEGCFSVKDIISPSYINITNPKYIEIDNVYYSGLIISNYYRKYTDLILKKLMDTNCNINISIFYEKQDTYKTIRDLTYHIGNVGVDLKSINENTQTIITSVDTILFEDEFLKDVKVYKIENGHIL